jgi:hypothetical protein
MPRFPLLLAAVALGAALALPVGTAAQAGPVEVFRAYWDSGLAPTDPGAERFRSQAMLREFRAFLEEEPEMAREALEFMTAMYRELQEAAALGSIEVVEQTPDRATLEVEFQGKQGPLPEGLPQRATVEMVREEDGWKVETEAFTSSMGGGWDDEFEEATCPAGTVLGDPAAPHTLVLWQDGGTVQVHFSDALLLRDGRDLTLRLPAMGSSQMDVRVPGGATDPGDHAGSIGGSLAWGGCPGFPEGLFHGEGEVLFTWEVGSAAATANVEFDVSPAGGGSALLSGSLAGVSVLDVTPAPLMAESFLLAFDEEVNPHRGAILHHAAEGRLEISLHYSRGNGGGSSSFFVEGFAGEPGVYVGKVSWGNVQVAVVEAFGGGGIRMELWEIPEEEFPAEGLDAARARELGSLRARVVSDGVVVVPSLAAVGL